ncbi:Mediator of RNA polymerase II transcription subunit 7 [Pleosporales sp. CAS-2024a]
MADADAQRQAEEDQALKIAPFPPPPPYYLHFTAENKARLAKIKTDAGIDTEADGGSSAQLSAEQILALPTELRCLLPPEPPADRQEFSVFGQTTQLKGRDEFNSAMELIAKSMAQTLPHWKYEQLYPSTSASDSASATLDRQRFLFRFLRSILVAYIELLGISAANPTDQLKDDKLKDILTMVTNMHALLNEYRPHQARETLIREMERQVDRKKREIESVKRMKDRVAEILDGFGRHVPIEKGQDAGDEAAITSEDDRRRDAQRQMWQALDEMLGQ